MTRYSDYDAFAWVYNKHWGIRYAQLVLPTLEKLILPRLPENSHILDLCCGTGRLAQALVTRGYQVTGLDGSQEMIGFARKNAPAAEFIVDDARHFKLPDLCHAVICMYDSLNHIMTLEGLTSAFHNVYAALRVGGMFFFDLNMDEGYKARWHNSFSIVEDELVCVVRNSYRPEEKVGQANITIFRLEGDWRRSDLRLVQKCYSEEEIRSALDITGFTHIQTYDGLRDLELSREVGRTFFVCDKHETKVHK
jgi:SAM-dependent methyltransferase